MEALNQAVNPSVSEEEQAQLQRALEQFPLTLTRKMEYYEKSAKDYLIRYPKTPVFEAKDIEAAKGLVQEAGIILSKKFNSVFGINWSGWLWRFLVGKKRADFAEHDHVTLSLAFKDTASNVNGMTVDFLMGMFQKVMERYNARGYWVGDSFFKEVDKAAVRYGDVVSYAGEAAQAHVL